MTAGLRGWLRRRASAKVDSYPWCSADAYRRAMYFSFCDECGQPMVEYVSVDLYREPR